MESKTEAELKISATALIENLNKDRYAKNPDALKNLKITFGYYTSNSIENDKEFEKILALLEHKKLSDEIVSLDVRHQLTKLPLNIGTLTKLKCLKLGHNKLGTLKGVEQLRTLSWLDVQGNQLKTLEGIEQLIGLTSLDICGNQLTTLKGIEQLKALSSLNLHCNRLTTLAGIEQLTALTSLDISSNQLTVLKDLEQLKALTSLNLYRNQLATLEGIEQLKALSSLNLYGNRLTTLTGIEQLTALTSLNVSSNQLITLEGVGQLIRLTSLDACGNKLTMFKGMEQLTALRSLTICWNQLTVLEGIGLLTALKWLDISSNQLTVVPIDLGNCAALESLNAKKNPLKIGTPTIEQLKGQWHTLQGAYCTEYARLNSAIKESTLMPEELIKIIINYTSEFAEKNSLSLMTISLLVNSVGNPQTWLEANGSNVMLATETGADLQESPKRSPFKKGF